MRRAVNHESPLPGGLLAAVALFPVVVASCALIAGIDAPVARATDAAVDDVAVDVVEPVDEATGGEQGNASEGSPNGCDAAADLSLDTGSPTDAPPTEASADSSPQDAKPDVKRNCQPGGAYCSSSFDCCSGSCTANYCD